MRLQSLFLANFRCFKQAVLEDAPQLLILIGENDSGKTSVVEALEVLLGSRQLQRADVRGALVEEAGEERVVLQASFALAEGTTVGRRLTVGGEGRVLTVRRSFDRQDLSSRFEALGMRYASERFESFGRNAANDKQALESIGLAPGANVTERQKQFEDAATQNKIPLVEGWVPIDEKKMLLGLPEVRRISSSDYADPSREIARLVQDAVRKKIASRIASNPQEFAEITEVARSAAQDKVDELTPHLQAVLPHTDGLTVATDLDFGRPHVDTVVRLDFGGEHRDLDTLGYGSRRRAWMAVEHFRAQVEESTTHVLRLYDEPDSNLHYEAQRQFFRSIVAWTKHNPNASAVVCTHAVTLIDGASPASIRTIEPNADRSESVIRSLVGTADAADVDVMAELGSSVGLSNLALIYERAFLVVEGETEERAIPHLYKTIYNTSMKNDGIRLVNIDGCGAWRSVVKVLLASRVHLLRLLLDTDCRGPTSTAKLNERTLTELLLSNASVSLVGTKEFEDAFGDSVWARTFNNNYARHDGAPWVDTDIAARRSDQKFSESLVNLIYKESEPTTRSRASKPEVGDALGQNCLASEVPVAIKECFEAVRGVAGIAS